MGAETIATLVVTAVIVAALAVYLLAIGLALRKLSFTLGTILVGLRAIRHQTTPVGPVLGDLVQEVDHIEHALEGLVAAVEKTETPLDERRRPIPTMTSGVAPARSSTGDVAAAPAPRGRRGRGAEGRRQRRSTRSAPTSDGTR